MTTVVVTVVVALLVAIVLWVAHLERMDVSTRWHPDDAGWIDGQRNDDGGESDE